MPTVRELPVPIQPWCSRAARRCGPKIDPDAAGDLARRFAALGDPVPLRLLSLLAHSPVCA